MKRSILPLVLVASCAAGAPAPPPVAPARTLPAAPPSSPATSDDAAIDEAARATLDVLFELRPELATKLGVHARDTELDDYTMAGAEAATRRKEAALASLRARFSVVHASRARRVDLEVLEHALDVDVRRDRELRALDRRPQRYLDVLETLFAMIARPYAPAGDRARAVVARLEKVPAVIAAAKANLRRPPRVWTENAIDSARQSAAFLDQVEAFLASAPSDDRPRADRALASARGAFAGYAAFLQRDVLPRSDGDFAAGRATFDWLLRNDYALEEDADAIAMLGKRILDETEAQMNEVARRIDPKAEAWPEVTRRLKDHHPTADDLIPSYRREVARARAFLVAKDTVPFPPDDDCEVAATPPFLRSTTTASYDPAPPFDTATSKGFFFVTPAEPTMSAKEREQILRENDHADAVDTVTHETYPGHHLQLSFARLHPSLVRKAFGTALFEEGWGLYSEELMAELGYYTDEERLQQLEWTLVRAARILIDVGLHTKGMTFDQAVAILTDRVHLELPLALSEVKRYAETPTQPLSYLVGREKIFALREAYRKKDPARFTLKRFHEAVLSHGGISPTWIAEEMLAE